LVLKFGILSDNVIEVLEWYFTTEGQYTTI